jgi:aminopeptidase N
MPRPFATPATRTHFAPDCPVAITHTRLDLEPDLGGRKLRGRVTLSLRSRQDELAAVELDAVDMTIAAVTVDDAPAPATHYDGKRLRVELGRTYRRGETFGLAVAYACAPVRGLYFVGPDEAHPGRPLECWTQGQDEDSRFYFPCMDAPLVKSTSEVLCTAPAGLFVLSNGDLREQRALALRPGGSPLAVPGDPGVRAVRRDQDTRARDRRRGVLLRAAGPRGRHRAQPAGHAGHHRLLQQDHRRALPVLALQPDLRL